MFEDFVINDYLKGISKILNDYVPSMFKQNALTCSNVDYRSDTCSWRLDFVVEGNEYFIETENGLFCKMKDGLIESFKEKELSPLVLIEKRSRFLKEDKKDFVKTLDIGDFHVIRGVTLAKALTLIEFVVSSVTKYVKVGEKVENLLLSQVQIDKVVVSDTFKFRFESLMNHTFRGTEFLPIFLELDNPFPKYLRTIKCPCFLILEMKNPLHFESEKRKVLYHSEKCAKSLRKPHYSHLGKLDMLESPESEAIGLTLFLTRDAIYDPVNLCIKGGAEDEIFKNPELALSYSSSCVPFLNYSDGPRVTMGGKNLKQGIPVDRCEKPRIRTSEDEVLDFGVNAFVGYMMYEGYNFEDGIVVSESFAKKMKYVKYRTVKNSILFDVFSFDKKSEEQNEFSDYRYICCEFQEAKKANSKIKRDLNKYRRCYGYKYKGKCYDGEVLLEEFVERKLCLKAGRQGAGNAAVYEDNWEILENSKKVLMRYKGLYPAEIESAFQKVKAIDYKEIPITVNRTSENTGNVYHQFKKKSKVEKSEFLFNIREEKCFDIGDKMTGRHGNKGTVSKILPDDEMPEVIINQTTGEKKRLDCLLSPMGVVSRMNIGQLLEIHASMVCNDYVVSPFSFSGDDVQALKKKLMERGADEWGYFRLTDNRRIAAGYQYVVRLDHCVRDKLHVVRKAAVSVLNGQPLKGRRRDGGQRIGEMEFWTLFSHRAFNVIEDFARTNVDLSSNAFKRLYKNFDKYNFEIFNGLFNESFETYQYKKLKKSFKSSSELIQDDLNTSLSVEFIPNTEEIAKTDAMSPAEKARKSTVDDFFHGHFGKTVKLLNGKEGYLRKHMLGRRIHFSGRTTISPAPDLEMNVVRLPVDVGIEWFKAEVVKEFNHKQIKQIRQGENSVLRREMTEFLNEHCRQNRYFVLLNRQPSLHRHSIQAFHLEFCEHYSIALPTIVCEAFGADFDGDTMAFYFPVFQFKTSDRKELLRMLPTSNPNRLGDRKTAWSSAQDFAFGQYILDASGKDGVEDAFFKISQSDTVENDMQDYKMKILEASSQELSLSFFDATTSPNSKSPGPFLKVFKASKARGKEEQFIQLTKEIEMLESKRNFGQGLSVEDYFCLLDNGADNIATRSRTNLMEKKLSVANAGYFTRKMVSFLYPYVVKEADCLTDEGFVLSRAAFDELNRLGGKKTDEENAKDVFDLKRFVLGRYIKEENGEWSADPVDEIRYELLRGSDWDEIEIRSPLKCKCENGLCKKCHGVDIARARISDVSLPRMNEFVGVSAGHVIGEFGTQLSMKTFQTGSNFTPEKLSGLFFSRYGYDEDRKRDEKIELKSYMAYLQNIARQKAGSDSLFKSIGVFSIHMEILYRYMEICDVKKESEMKRLFKFANISEMGLLSSLSFESARLLLLGTPGIFDLISFDEDNKYTKVFVEKSPSVTYMFANPVLKKVFDDE